MQEIDTERASGETPLRRASRITKAAFWAVMMKLSPARRVIALVALLLISSPLWRFGLNLNQLTTTDLCFAGSLLLIGVLAFELADRVSLKRDLEIARDIQGWLMPAVPPVMPNTDIAFTTRPANTVAGDYYDAFIRPPLAGETQSGCDPPPLMLVVADVAGKGVPAALLMATLQASLHTLAALCVTPLDLVTRLNKYACAQNIGHQRFTTAFLAEWQPANRSLTYVNAGHNWPILLRASGLIERLDVGGLPLGVKADTSYASASIVLAPGDLLIIFTDGLVEAENNAEEEFGEQRMLSSLMGSSGSSASEILMRILSSIDNFVDSAPQHDDMTCLIVRHCADMRSKIEAPRQDQLQGVLEAVR